MVHILDEFTAYSDQLGVSWRSVLEQTNNVGRGPLGVPTNSPISDSGTSARIQNRPSVPIGTAIPKHGDGKLSARLGGNRKQRTAQLPELQMGTRGSAVQRLQRLLNSRLPSEIPLKVDGIFGPKTRAAVVAFQRKAEVKPDGIVGRKTWFSLVLAEHKEPSVKPKPVAAPSASSAFGIATTGPAPTPEAAPAATAPPKKRGVDEWSMEERFKYVVTHTLGHLKPEFRAQFAALLTPMNIGIMVGSLVVWAAGHFFGVSEIADAFLLGFGLVFLGKAAIDAARLLKNVIELTCSASTEAELEDAAKDLAEAIAIIGVVAFFFLLAKVARAIGNKLKAARETAPPAEKEAPPESKAKPDAERPKSAEEPKESRPSPEEIVAQRKAAALDFYRSKGWPEEKIASHMKGIDFSKPVEVTTLKPGTVMSQWQKPGAPQGNYYTPPGTDPATLGIDTAGRVETQYVVKEPVQALQSTAADVPDWRGSGVTYQGGGSQYFTTDGSSFQAQ